MRSICIVISFLVDLFHLWWVTTRRWVGERCESAKRAIFLRSSSEWVKSESSLWGFLMLPRFGRFGSSLVFREPFLDCLIHGKPREMMTKTGATIFWCYGFLKGAVLPHSLHLADISTLDTYYEGHLPWLSSFHCPPCSENIPLRDFEEEYNYGVCCSYESQAVWSDILRPI